MAEESEEYFQLLEEIDINQLMDLQAHIRGTLTRRWQRELRLEYQQICREIERKDLNIEWPSEQPCLPKIVSKRHKKIQRHSEKLKEEKLSVEVQTDFDTSPAEAHHLNSVRELGAGTVSDPVVINDSVLDVSIHTDTKPDGLDSLENIPVRDTDSSPVQVVSQDNSDNSVLDNRNGRGGLHTNLLSENSQVPNCERTTVTEIQRSDNSVMCDVTSVWDAELSSFATEEIRLPAEKSELKDLRKNLAMELLWIQQAIQSRKNYLRLKNQMGT